MKILFAVAAWGLGHATRDLVLIRPLLQAGHEVTIVSTGRALRLLQSELGAACDYLDLPDIPIPLDRKAFFFYVKMSLSMPLVFWTFRREHLFVQRLCRERRFDRVVSDSRYGILMEGIPSYIIVHSLRQIIPGRPRPLETMVEAIQRRLFAGERRVLVPDQQENGLAGDLCHNLALSWQRRVEYMGILSSVQRRDMAQDVDYFITVSGAEPQRSIFEDIVLDQVPALRGRVVITLGKPDQPVSVQDDGRVQVHSYMNRAQQEEMMNRARLVVSRSGYTTLMELAELGKRALLIPTHGQSEQEYLATYHEKLRTMHSVIQFDLDLARDVDAAQSYSGIPLSRPTSETIRRFIEILEE